MASDDGLTDEQHDKNVGQFRLRLNVLLNIFRCYGMENSIAGVVEGILALADIYCAREMGEDIEYPDVGKDINGLGKEI